MNVRVRDRRLLILTPSTIERLSIVHIFKNISSYFWVRNWNLIGIWWRNERSQRRCSIWEAVLKVFAIFTWKHLHWSLFLIKLQSFSSATLLKIGFITGVFLWILRAKSIRTPTLINICKRLLLKKLL